MTDIKQALKKISPYIWEIPSSFRSDMLVPCRIFASDEMIEKAFEDHTLEQLVNVATLRGIKGAALAMPDAHEGYGFPIGGVAAIEYPDGVISPGGIGYDINCGVRMLTLEKSFDEIKGHLHPLAKALFHSIPSGVGRGSTVQFSRGEFIRVLEEGAAFLVRQGYGQEEDLEHIESRGTLAGSAPDAVSSHALERGEGQVGTMGAGNHFVEVDVVDKIYDSEKAKAWGLFEGQVALQIHTGSRGLGHQVATDYIRIMGNCMGKYDIHIPDRELACAPFSSQEGQNYFGAMNAAANFAFANRQMITHFIRETFRKHFGPGQKINVLYDVCHNIAKIEEYEIEGKKQKLIIHRKGATRAFPDQPVLIPGSMGTASYVLSGTKKALEISYGSTCHGAGRAMSRHAAKRKIQGSTLLSDLEAHGIAVAAGSMSGLAEEAPFAYKDVDAVVDVVHNVGIATRVAHLKPCAVIKG
jgi:tRNA-splicing ligase RtcB (3'-phosphate/5'-hydroxy nucleic acid ligase)